MSETCNPQENSCLSWGPTSVLTGYCKNYTGEKCGVLKDFWDQFVPKDPVCPNSLPYPTVMPSLHEYAKKQEDTIQNLKLQLDHAHNMCDQNRFAAHYDVCDELTESIAYVTDTLVHLSGNAEFYQLWRKITSKLLDIADLVQVTGDHIGYCVPYRNYRLNDDVNNIDEGVDMEWDNPFGRQNYLDAIKDANANE